MAANTLGRNITFQIYNGDGTPFEGLILHKSVVDSVVMSLGDNITGDVYYKNNALNVTMNEYIEYKGVKYVLVNPPTILREGMVKDNGELKGMTKYSFTFYHPMYQLGNMPFCDVAVSSDQQRYLSENKAFSWIGYPNDYIAKLNKNLDGTEWIVEKSNRFPALKNSVLSEVLSFENNTIADALKTFYDTWEVPYVVDVVSSSESSYAQGKRFKVVVGLPSNEIYASESDKQLMQPYVFKMGQGVGLKNNSRTPRNNKIITRISGYGSEDNIPYGYPQIVWDGAEDDPRLRYPLYDGIVGGRYVKLIKHPFTRTHLMPSIYSETVNKKVNPNAVGYDPTIELKDYYDAIRTEEYPYVNEINPLAPSYESHEFDVKPEMNDGQSSVEILDAIPLNADLTPAESWDDTMDGDGNYLQSYFQITLPVLSFDLYACAAITQEMSINMRGGACIGCTFPIQVNWDDYKANFYDQDGNFAPDGEQRDLTKYPKSNLESISVVVQKEYQTFGTIMPNVFQQPKNGDEFVVLGISLPSEYISNAEERLDREMKSYMLENNVYYYDYPLKFDEYFLATHTYILEQLKPNSVVRFDFAGNELQLFVKQLTIKYGENVLPQYDITLTDNVEVVLNQIGQVAEDVERLSSVISILRESYGRNVWTELSKKLSKVNDDTAQGFIRFIKGLQVGERFVSGLLGEGAVFRKEADGTTYLEADKMYVRMKAYFDTVEIRKYLHSAGNRVASVAGAKCIRVEYIDADGNVTSDAANAVVFRCYFRGSDGDDEVTNDFLVGDQVYCHITNGSTQSLQMHHYWRLLVGRNAEGELTEDGEHWIDLSNRPTETVTIDGSTYTHAGYQTGSDIPVAQDDMVQLGNINDTTRQGAIIEYVSGADSPSYQIYQGINDFSLNGKNQLALGYNTQTGRAYLNVYGDAYIGDRNGASYIRYNTATKKMEIKAEVNIQSTFDGKTLPDYIAEHSSDWTEEEITALFTDDFNNIDAEIKNIQKQVDGSIETWFYNGVPSSSVLPESEWKAKDIAAGNNNERLKHLGDLYYDNQSGYAYRYTNQGTESVPQFVWTQISDSAVIKALENAAKAQDTADHKRRVFVRQPLDSEDYDVGDLWVNATYPSGNTQTDDANGRYYNDILKCIKHKDKNVAFSISDWGLSSKYTDDSALEQFKLNSYVQQLTGGELSQDIADAKQAADDAQADADAAAAAAANAKTAADNAQADATAANNRLNGWANDGSISPTEKTSLKLEWENVKKEYTQICNDADKYGVLKNDFTSAYSSANAAFQKYTAATPENITIGSDYDNIKAYYQARQTILDAITQAAKKVATDAATAAANAQAKADSAYTLAGQANAHAALFDSIRTALNQGTLIDGGLVLSTLIGLRDGDNKLWSGISGAYNADLFGGGLAAWYGGGLADAEHKSQYPSGSDWAKSAFRFDGSGYLAGGNITWDKDGIVTIANVYSDVSGTKVPLYGTSLQYLNNIVNLLPTKLIDGVNYIDPKTSFTTINALNEIKINGKQVATQEYVSQNYLSIAFFKRLFQAHNGSANVNPNDTSTTITDIEAMFGFWTNQYISALGKGSGGSGGGGVGDVTWDLLASNSDTRQVALSHLTGALTGYATTSQLAGYLPLTGGDLYNSTYDAVFEVGNAYDNDITTMRCSYDHYGVFIGTKNTSSQTYYILNCVSGISSVAGTGGESRLFVRCDGNVGIGTANPTQKLDVAGLARCHHMVFKNYNDNGLAGYVGRGGKSSNRIYLTAYAGNACSIGANGEDNVIFVNTSLNVGIGTITPSYKLHVVGNIYGSSFIKDGGTSAQFLKADGSVDSNTYATTAQLGNYLPLTGGTLNSNGGQTTLYIKQTSSMLELASANGNNYIESYGATTGSNAPLYITGQNGSYGSTLNLVFSYTEIRSNATDWALCTNTEKIKTYISHGGGYGIAVDSWVYDSSHYLLKLSSVNGGTGIPPTQFIVKSDGKVGIGQGIDNPAAKLDVYGTAKFMCDCYTTTSPSLGALGVGTIGFYSVDSNGVRGGYGLFLWSNYSHGCSYFQAGYDDNTIDAPLGLCFQPLGGKVGIGYNYDVRTLDYTFNVNGTINASTGIYVNGAAVLTSHGYIGTTAVQASSATQAVTGLSSIKFANATSYLYNSSGETIFNTNAGNIVLGWDMSKADYHTYIDGNTIHFRTNTTHTEVLRLANNSHVLIGDYSNDYGRLNVLASSGGWAFVARGTYSGFFAGHDDGYGVAIGSTLSTDSIYLFDVLKGRTTTVSGGTSVFKIYGSGRIEQDGYITFGDNTYFRGSPSHGFRFNDHNSNYNNLIIRENGTVYIRSGLSINRTDISSYCKLDINGQARCTYMYFKNYGDDGLAGYVGRGGSASNNVQFTAYSGNCLGLGANDKDNVLFINTAFNIGIGTTSPSYKLHVNGTVKATKYYLSDTVYFELTSDGVHLVGAGFYSDSFVSALGVGSGSSGGGIDAEWLKNNDVQIKRLGVGVAPSASYQLNVQGASTFTGTVDINSRLIVNSSVSAIGGFSTSQGSISAAHDITAGGNGLIYGRLTVGQSSVNTSYNLYVNGTSYFNGNVGIAGYNSGYKLYIGGGGSSKSIYAEGDIYTHGSEVDYSDVRLKNIVSYINDIDINMVAKAPIFRYTWKDRINDRLRAGTSAQYWQNVLPQAVELISDGFLGMSYATTALIASVITARKVVDHELHIKQLEERVRELESEIKQLKAA